MSIKRGHEVVQFNPSGWALDACLYIHEQVKSILSRKGACNLILTGGGTAKKIYLNWSRLDDFHRLEGVNFYFGDERAVLPGHPDSNYGMVMQTLFKYGVPKGCSVIQMEINLEDLGKASLTYEKKIPAIIDILLITVGDDGHIASLFPRSAALKENQRLTIFTEGGKPFCARLTITPAVIKRSEKIIVLAPGKKKAKVLLNLKNEICNFESIPAALVFDGTWLMD